jgi:hypothetical protein
LTRGALAVLGTGSKGNVCEHPFPSRSAYGRPTHASRVCDRVPRRPLHPAILGAGPGLRSARGRAAAAVATSVRPGRRPGPRARSRWAPGGRCSTGLTVRRHIVPPGVPPRRAARPSGEPRFPGDSSGPGSSGQGSRVSATAQRLDLDARGAGARGWLPVHRPRALLLRLRVPDASDVPIRFRLGHACELLERDTDATSFRPFGLRPSLSPLWLLLGHDAPPINVERP